MESYDLGMVIGQTIGTVVIWSGIIWLIVSTVRGRRKIRKRLDDLEKRIPPIWRQ